MRKLKELILRIKMLFGYVPTTHPFIQKVIEFCENNTNVSVWYYGGPTQGIQVGVTCHPYNWVMFYGRYKKYITVIHGDSDLSRAEPISICFQFSLLDFGYHGARTIANFSQSETVYDTNISLSKPAVQNIANRLFQSCGDGYFTIL